MLPPLPSGLRRREGRRGGGDGGGGDGAGGPYICAPSWGPWRGDRIAGGIGGAPPLLERGSQLWRGIVRGLQPLDCRILVVVFDVRVVVVCMSVSIVVIILYSSIVVVRL